MSDTCAELNRRAGIVVNLEDEETCTDCGQGLGFNKGTPIDKRPCYIPIDVIGLDAIGPRCLVCQSNLLKAFHG
jgi:hypothetical protein